MGFEDQGPYIEQTGPFSLLMLFEITGAKK
jgi:hypothetical protein